MSSGHGGGMLRTIFTTALVVLILGAIAYWILSGGPQRAWNAGKNFTNPISMIFANGTSTGVFLTLPWQSEMVRGPDISDYVGVADQQLQDSGAVQAGGSNTSPSQLAGYGDPSPYAGQVTMTDNNAAATDPSKEYITLEVSSDVTAPITISGWVLQSAVSGMYGVIPQAADTLIAGTVNDVGPVSIPPGGTAIVITAASPVGVSFRENMCSGYLAQVQRFTPYLASSCPSPSDILPQTPENLRTFGSDCVDYAASVQRCHSPAQEMPSTLSPACRTFLANNLSYNGCVAMYRSRSDFSLPAWRLYLALRQPLWTTTHDVVRLLDEQGRVVDVLSY